MVEDRFEFEDVRCDWELAKTFVFIMLMMKLNQSIVIYLLDQSSMREREEKRETKCVGPNDDARRTSWKRRVDLFCCSQMLHSSISFPTFFFFLFFFFFFFLLKINEFSSCVNLDTSSGCDFHLFFTRSKNRQLHSLNLLISLSTWTNLFCFLLSLDSMNMSKWFDKFFLPVFSRSFLFRA